MRNRAVVTFVGSLIYWAFKVYIRVVQETITKMTTASAIEANASRYISYSFSNVHDFR